MLLNYKYEMYPTEEQMEKLEKWISYCRHTYNSALMDKINSYKKDKKSVSRFELQEIQTNDKTKYPFLNEIPSQPLQEVFVRLEKAYQNFFQGDANYPKLKYQKSLLLHSLFLDSKSVVCLCYSNSFGCLIVRGF